MAQQQRAKEQSQARGTTKRLSSLQGLSGRLRIDLAGDTQRMFEVRDGAVEPTDGDGTVDASIAFDSEDSFQSVFSGRKNPVVMALQGRLRVEGNLALATKVLLALHAEGSSASEEAASGGTS